MEKIQSEDETTTRRRLPFESTTARMSSSTALKRAVANTFRYPQSTHRHEIFLNKSSSSSMTEDHPDDEEKTLDETLPENGLIESNQRQNSTRNHHRQHKRDIGGPMIQELLQSNMDLKQEIRDIRRQIKHKHATNKQRTDRTINSTNIPTKTKIFNDIDNDDDDDDCSFVPTEHDYYHHSSPTKSKLHRYKTEAAIYKQQLEACQETITHLRKTINAMEKRIEQLKSIEHRQGCIPSNQQDQPSPTNNTDHRFIHELFHLCIKYTPRSSKLKTTVPSHHDMKTFVRQTFTNLIKTPSSSSSSKISANKNSEISHFICKCSDRIHTEHRPTYQYALSIIEQCQALFDVTCFTQLSTAMNELYYRHGELTNFKRSIASTLGVTESSKSVSCPKLIRTLQQTLDDAKSNELITFKKMAKINDMNEAVSKIRSYDDFVPYYHQFIEQMANLLEVSKGDEIMPAIKTLKLLAHGENPSQTLKRVSSLNTRKNPLEKSLTQSRSLRILPSKSPENKIKPSEEVNNNNSEQPATDDGDS